MSSHSHCKKEKKCRDECTTVIIVPQEPIRPSQPEPAVKYAQFHFTLPTTIASAPLDMKNPIHVRHSHTLGTSASSGGNVSFQPWIPDPTQDITISASDPTTIIIKEGGIYQFHFEGDITFPTLTTPTGFILSIFVNGVLVQPSQYFDVLSAEFAGVDPFSHPNVSLGLPIPANASVGLFLNTASGAVIRAVTNIFEIARVR